MGRVSGKIALVTGAAQGLGEAISRMLAREGATVLVDGLGQAQPSRGMTLPAYGRIIGWEAGDDYTYIAGDVTGCYPREPGNYSRWSLPLHEVYQQRALPHLKRFVRHIVYARERYRCSSPVCHSRNQTPHHIRFRSRGGDDSRENLTAPCACCHLDGIHQGNIKATGPASALHCVLVLTARAF